MRPSVRKSGILALLLAISYGGYSLYQDRPTSLFAANFLKFPHLSNRDIVHQECRDVVTEQRALLYDYFGDVLKDIRTVAVVGFPNHPNKGDSAIWVAQETLLASLGVDVAYRCAVHNDYNATRLAEIAEQEPNFAIMLVGGGNTGDLYGGEQNVKLRAILDFPDVPIIGFPQSIHFKDLSMSPNSALARYIAAIQGAKDVRMAFRDLSSVQFARKHFVPVGAKVALTPDIVFALGSRPDLLRSFGKPSNSLLVFRRRDKEKTDWQSWTGTADSKSYFTELLSELGPPWNSSLITVNDWLNGDISTEDGLSMSKYNHVAWARTMHGARWLASGEVVVLDRLHGHILALIMGIPHIAVDNSIGKLGNYHNTWTRRCRLAKILNSPDKATMKQALVQQRSLVLADSAFSSHLETADQKGPGEL